MTDTQTLSAAVWLKALASTAPAAKTALVMAAGVKVLGTIEPVASA